VTWWLHDFLLGACVAAVVSAGAVAMAYTDRARTEQQDMHSQPAFTEWQVPTAVQLPSGQYGENGRVRLLKHNKSGECWVIYGSQSDQGTQATTMTQASKAVCAQ
jgi:hypothetical protein